MDLYFHLINIKESFTYTKLNIIFPDREYAPKLVSQSDNAPVSNLQSEEGFARIRHLW